MTIEKMFETAVRSKFRFAFKGWISTEDLWDLSLENLDQVYKTLNSQLKQRKEESLLTDALYYKDDLLFNTKQDKELNTKIEIVKYIVGTKIQEEELKVRAKARKDQKQKILALISEKQDQNLQSKSVEELSAMLNELD